MPATTRPLTHRVVNIGIHHKSTGPYDHILRPQPPVRASPLVSAAVAVLCDIWPSPPSHIQLLTQFTCEVLRRSQFSKHMLETALYYLVKLKPHVEDSRIPILHCPRKMFLSALILAGKYVQDRPFSMQAWAKISGLQPTVLARNELAFLEAINWDLFIPHHGFESLHLHVNSIRGLPLPIKLPSQLPLISPAASDSESAPDLLTDDESTSSDSC